MIAWLMLAWSITGMTLTAKYTVDDNDYVTAKWSLSFSKHPLKTALAGPIAWALVIYQALRG
ncbi:hypothetical protein NDQ72_01580 [Halomonas sp. KG2]|uniref:hypothetical protein n=1 Tax=Halomonas sp. KG2 TaxID=2951138 RepID=UPI00264A48E9|nr:hypothetical protein [Halomonas sp. KG2]WKD28666.1 hypothetical protein NDQ72_01580 [Halomonas sp. KG2]